MPSLFVLCGMPYSGKSTLAAQLAPMFDAKVISLDAINEERGLGFGGDGHIPPAEWEQTHQLAMERIRVLFACGCSVVLDDTGAYLWLRDRYRLWAKEMGVSFAVLYCDVGLDVLRQRMAENLANPTRPHVQPDVFEQLAEVFEPPYPEERDVVVVTPDSSTEEVVNGIAAVLTRTGTRLPKNS